MPASLATQLHTPTPPRGRGSGTMPASSATPRAPARAMRIRPADALAPAALVLWGLSLSTVRPSTMSAYGLLAALPATFYVALGLLVVSIVVVLQTAQESPLRLGLHLVALVVILHGTVPLVIPGANYPWTYKHVGVTDYVSLHGSVKASIDIYQSWPGFFGAAAWFTRIAGVSSPLAYATWAPLYFNLLTCLMLGFAFRSLPVSSRTRWLAMFLFVAGNWIGQDYFSPQALAYVLTLAVLAIVLTWFQADQSPALIGPIARRVRRLVRAPERVVGRELAQIAGADADGCSRRLHAARLAALFAVFAAIVVTHQLSPYMVILSVGALIVAGKLRPRWLGLVLAVEALAYLIPNLAFLQRTQNLFGSLLQPFGNVGLSHLGHSTPELGHRIVTLAAPGLVLGLWALAAIGVVRRLRAGRPTLLLALLAGTPGLLVLLQSYGGEAILRVYLFSLPWTALLAASALNSRSGGWRLLASARVGLILGGVVVLFMSAFYGSEELYEVQPGALQASQYFYGHAPPGSVLILGAPQFPLMASANYVGFISADPTPSLITDLALLHRELGPRSVPAVSALAASAADGHAVFLALTADEQAYDQVLGLLPKGSLASLGAALARAPQWRVVYRNPVAAIYRYEGGLSASRVSGRSQSPGSRGTPAAAGESRPGDVRQPTGPTPRGASGAGHAVSDNPALQPSLGALPATWRPSHGSVAATLPEHRSSPPHPRPSTVFEAGHGSNPDGSADHA